MLLKILKVYIPSWTKIHRNTHKIQRRSISFVSNKAVTNLKSEVAQLCPTLCDPMDCSLPGSEEPLSPWNFPGKSTGVGCHFLLQGIFPTQGSNWGLPHCRQMLYHLSHQGSLGDQPWQHIKKQRHYLTNKCLISQSYDFSSSHVLMWELDYKESWAPKSWFWTVVLEKTLESPLDCKEIQPVHPKGNQSWISLEGLMLKLKLQFFGYLMWRTDSFEKTLMLGKTEGGRRRGQQRMRWLDGITNSMDMSLEVGDGQGGLACCSPWSCRKSDMTEQLNWTDLAFIVHLHFCKPFLMMKTRVFFNIFKILYSKRTENIF